MAIACPDCGTIQTLPALGLGDAAICPTCDHHLERTAGRSIVAAFSCAFSTFILLFPANLLPLMSVTMLSVRHTSHLSSGIGVLWSTHWVVIAALVAAFALVLPFMRFGLLSIVLGCTLTRHRPAWLGSGFRWSIALDAWAMPDVFLIGCAVGYSRVSANLPVVIEWGGICFIAAALLAMLSRASLDRRTVWRAIGPERQLDEGAPVISCTICDLVVPAEQEGALCARCRHPLDARKPDTLIRTTALIIAGAALYIPANVFPMSNALQMGELVHHRIVDGVRELIQAGLWPLAILITCTSIVIPLLKLVGLGWFVVSVHRHSRSHLIFKTKLYRLIDELGRWSCIDVFTIAVFLPLLHFGQLANTSADTGAAAFIAVVTVTMIASRSFDPRLLWDEAR